MICLLDVTVIVNNTAFDMTVPFCGLLVYLFFASTVSRERAAKGEHKLKLV